MKTLKYEDVYRSEYRELADAYGQIEKWEEYQERNRPPKSARPLGNVQ
jgi:hypothetical protein